MRKFSGRSKSGEKAEQEERASENGAEAGESEKQEEGTDSDEEKTSDSDTTITQNKNPCEHCGFKCEQNIDPEMSKMLLP